MYIFKCAVCSPAECTFDLIICMLMNTECGNVCIYINTTRLSASPVCPGQFVTELVCLFICKFFTLKYNLEKQQFRQQGLNTFI